MNEGGRKTVVALRIVDAGTDAHVLKLPVAKIVLERRMGRLLFAAQGIEGRAVNQIDVRTAVAVIIKDSDAAGRRIENIVFRSSAGVMSEVRHRRPGSH